MITPDFSLQCKQVQPYYYDFLREERHELIPKVIINHIKQCPTCQEQINQLKAVISKVQAHLEPLESRLSLAIAAMLEVHFTYISKPVTCDVVRPFLLGLLDPALEIGIPTPITAHLDNCQQCSEDLETLRRLNLNCKQSIRLSQLFAEETPEGSAECSEMGETAKSVAGMDFDGLTVDALMHLCKCPVCRALVYEERQELYDSLPEYDQPSEFPCESVSTVDIFDYVVPYGLDPSRNQYAKFREALTSHLRICRTCLAKMQQLHNTVYGIAERAESDVVTVYHIDESAKTEARSESDDIYVGFPIRVETVNREDGIDAELPVSTIDFGTALKQKVSARNVKSLVKIATVAAAILIGAAILIKTPAAKGLTIDQIYKALEKVKNVHISKFAPDRTSPIEERWVSRTLNIAMSKTEQHLVLWDIPNRARRSKQMDTGITETVSLTDDIVADVEKNMRSSLGLTPFYDISEIPPDREWSRVADDALEDISKSMEVYDLLWMEQGPSGPLVFKRCRLFIDPYTNLPHKIKTYRKIAADSQYTLRSKVVVEYLSDSEIQAVIENVGF
jgi:hypothetical protein